MDVRYLCCRHDTAPQQALLALSSAAGLILTGICIHLHAPKQAYQGHPHRPQPSQLQAYAFAKKKKRVLVRWRIRVSGLEAQSLSAAHVDELYAAEPCLWAYFVYNAPCVITDNFAQGKGLVNGTRGFMHSLVMPDTAARDRLHAQLRRAHPGDVVTLSGPPRYINVVPTVSEKFAALLRPDSLAPDRIVVPCGYPRNGEEFKPTSTYAAMYGIGRSIRRKKKDGSLTKKKTSGLLTHDHCVSLALSLIHI